MSKRPPLFEAIAPVSGEAMIPTSVDILLSDEGNIPIIEIATERDGVFHFAIAPDMLREIGQLFVRAALVVQNVSPAPTDSR